MKQRIVKAHSTWKSAEAWIFFAATVFFGLFAALEVTLHIGLLALPRSIVLRVLLILIICTLFYLSALLTSHRQNSPNIFGKLLTFFFLLYIYLLLNVTLLEKGFGRNALALTREEYLHRFVNLRPFCNIYGVYIKGFLNGSVSSYYTLLNLLGNIVAFMPLAFFLPVFFQAQRRALGFISTIFGIVTLIECLQFTFMVGSCDIDDLILNTIGAIALYFLLRTRICKCLMSFAFGKDWTVTQKNP